MTKTTQTIKQRLARWNSFVEGRTGPFMFHVNFPLHEREKEIFGRLAYVDVQHLTARIRAEVLMATGLMDTLCLPCTQFAAFNRIRSPKRVLLYPESGHETPPGFWDKACEFLADW